MVSHSIILDFVKYLLKCQTASRVDAVRSLVLSMTGKFVLSSLDCCTDVFVGSR